MNTNALGNDSSNGPEYKARVMANIISQETTVNYVVTKVALGEADVGFAYVSDVTKDRHPELIGLTFRMAILDRYGFSAVV